jgi:hypothetical protein
MHRKVKYRSQAKKRSPFRFSARFARSPAHGLVPAANEVGQEIRWDGEYHRWRNGRPPNSGFSTSASADTWHEDRDIFSMRFGHRSGPYSQPIINNCSDEYRTGSTRDQRNGNGYCGFDPPTGPESMRGAWQYQLKEIDSASSNAVKATSSNITVNRNDYLVGQSD